MLEQESDRPGDFLGLRGSAGRNRELVEAGPDQRMRATGS